VTQPPDNLAAARLRRLLWLSLLSGVCGIAYELLYARLLTTWLGDMFYVSAGILSVFLLGIGTGSWLAARFSRWLWLIEALIGVYAIAAAVTARAMGIELLELLTPATAGSPGAVVIAVMALLGVPATLVGFSVPLFAQRLAEAARDAGHFTGFHRAYVRYNIGAGLAVLALEYSVLRNLGITGALLAVASLNLLIGAALLLDGDSRFEPADAPEPPREARDHAGLLPLFVVSAASGVFQLFVLKLVATFLGPYHENFALVLALGLLGVSAGSMLVDRWRGGFARLLLIGSAAIAVSLAMVALWVPGWGYINGLVGVGLGLPIFAKVLILALVAGAGYIVFGATVPALLADERWQHITPGRALAYSAFGNFAGYLSTALVLHAALSSLGIALLVSVVVALCGAFAAVAGDRLPASKLVGRGAVVLAAVILLGAMWPPDLLTHSYRDLVSPTALRKARGRMEAVSIHKKYDSHVAILRSRDGTRTLHINGYRSMVVRGDGVPNLHELLYGVTPAVFAPNHERALVLGLGTGLTAAGTAPLFDNTDVVEIDPAIVDLLSTFAEENYHLADRPGVRVMLEDGLAALAEADKPYDAIINTVTTPLYFSSSKLYSREFLQLVRRRLAKGGVYAMWFDQRVTVEGARTIFRTVADVFPHCAVLMLKTGYYQLICSGEPIKADGAALTRLPAPIRKVLEKGAGGMTVERLVRSLAFTDHRLHTNKWQAPLHTFDRPELEFVMARRAFGERQDARIHHILRLDFERSPGAAGGVLDGDGLIDRCIALAAIATGVPAPCTDALARRHGGRIPKRYDKRLVDLATRGIIEPKGDIAAWTLGLAMKRMDLADFAGAQQIADRLELKAEKLKGNTRLRILAGAWTIRVAIAIRRGDPVDSKLATAAYRHAPFDTTLRRALAFEMARIRRPRVGLAHIEALSRTGGLNNSDISLRNKLMAAASAPGLPAAATPGATR